MRISKIFLIFVANYKFKTTLMKKNYLLVAGVILAIIIIIFGLGFSEGLEMTIIVILGVFSLFSLFAGYNSKNETDRKVAWMGVLGLVITFGLLAWSGSNTHSRKEKEFRIKHEKNKLMWAEQAKEDSIQKVKDSIQHYKDSILIAEESKKLYEREGDTIFGKFLFGMSKKDFDNIKLKIEKETHGIISISGYDFKIDDYKFYNNKLYSITLKKTNSWTRYYYHDVNEYEEDNDGSDIVNKIRESFSKRYGSPNSSFGDWQFNHKHISVDAKSYSSSREGLLSTESWSVFITFKDPITKSVIDKAEQEKRIKAEQERKEAEEAFQKKKESFGGGL